MNRRPSSFRSLAVAATADAAPFAAAAAAMSSRPYYRGWRPQDRRGYSDRPLYPASGDHAEFVSGDSHYGAVRDANRGFRPSYNAVPPPPQYGTGQQFYGPGSQSYRPSPPVMQQFHGPESQSYRRGPPVMQQFHGPRPYRQPSQVGPAFGNYQQFRPQQMQQQFRPRASKPPDYRDWEYRKPGLPPHCERFTVLSYNILAEYLAIDHFQKLYFHIPRYMLDWNWRKRNICFELGLWSADILCFQEVDRFQEMEAELKPRGYNGIWKMRTGDPADGCAIFWRVSRFKLLHEESIEYNKLGLRDNVAQICVFETLKGPNKSNEASTPSTSSASSDRVVICNIHVLFNPKRGDIKLGQIRVLLDRAHAVSKLWDDAPVVICGDFNCTPKSPMYNFITEQKLDLSTLARDKISGQVSAKIGRPAYSDFRKQAAYDSTQPSAINSETTEQGDLPFDAPSTENYPKPECSLVDDTSRSYIGEEHRTRISNDLSSHDTADTSEIKSPICPATNTDEIALFESSSEDTPSKVAEVGEYVESDFQTKQSFPNFLDVASSKHEALDLSLSAANDNHDKLSCESEPASSESTTSADFMLDEKLEVLSLNEVVDGDRDNLGEDCDSFLSKLHDTSQSPVPAALDSSYPEQTLHPYGEHGIVTEGRNLSYSPSAWTPAEIQTATGNADCKTMEHPLNLTSAYPEIVNSPWLRDPIGEPLVTSHHRLFSGTVDYIWRSEGLHTVKVLAPIPKHVMQQTPGFPTKKWGSDHIALVSEFAFTKDTST
ncbi:hypothetical protein ABFX02_01G029800 [Erythranthe guttata]